MFLCHKLILPLVMALWTKKKLNYMRVKNDVWNGYFNGRTDGPDDYFINESILAYIFHRYVILQLSDVI